MHLCYLDVDFRGAHFPENSVIPVRSKHQWSAYPSNVSGAQLFIEDFFSFDEFEGEHFSEFMHFMFRRNSHPS